MEKNKLSTKIQYETALEKNGMPTEVEISSKNRNIDQEKDFSELEIS